MLIYWRKFDDEHEQQQEQQTSVWYYFLIDHELNFRMRLILYWEELLQFDFDLRTHRRIFVDFLVFLDVNWFFLAWWVFYWLQIDIYYHLFDWQDRSSARLYWFELKKENKSNGNSSTNVMITQLIGRVSDKSIVGFLKNIRDTIVLNNKFL